GRPRPRRGWPPRSGVHRRGRCGPSERCRGRGRRSPPPRPPGTPPAGRAWPGLVLLDGEPLDPDRLGRGVAALAADRDPGDLVDHLAAVDHLAEDRVVGLEALGVVLEVDEELAAARVGTAVG